jgi:uncharacterized phage protein (TIGR02220 family)
MVNINADQEKYSTVPRVYMNIRYIIIIINIIILNIIYNINNKQKEKRLSITHPVDKSMRKIPASPEFIFNSKLVLAELNNLVCPTIRRKPFPPSSLNLGPIIDQLKNDFSVQDCLHVVKNKFQQWHNSPSMHGALQPSTLFGRRFPNYVGEKLQEKGNEKSSNFDGSGRNRSTATARAAQALSVIGKAINDASSNHTG